MSAEQINNEYELSKKYDPKLETIEGTNLVSLTPENVAIVEAMIRFDSRYRQDDSDKYSPYWLDKMGKYLKGEIKKPDFETIVENAVNKIDTENSTHLNADGVGREQISKRIQEYEKTLLGVLKNRDDGFKFIEYLSKRTEPESGSQKRGRCNISFASKFCHYACFYIFAGEDAQDNFSIYDSVVAKVLPYYLNHYRKQIKLKKEYDSSSKDYEAYSEAIDAVIEASDSQISRYGFDHLLWYYFKNKELPKYKK